MWPFLKVMTDWSGKIDATRVIHIVAVVHDIECKEGPSFSENGKSLCPQILVSSDYRVLSMDVLKVVMGQLNQMYSIQCLFVSSRRGADLG